MTATPKLSPALAAQRAAAAPDDLITVVVELRAPAVHRGPAGRSAIEARKAVFERDSAPVDEAVRHAGGRIVDTVWLNHTLKALVPARSLDDLSRLAVIQAMDVPSPIHREARAPR